MKYRKLLLKQLHPNITIIPVSAYKNRIQTHDKYEWGTIESLKKIEYRGVKIGYAVLSSYLTMSRNLNPLIDKDFVQYVNTQLALTSDYTDLANAIIEDTTPNVVAAYNARFVYARPIIDTAVRLGIKHLCYETAYNLENKQVKITYDITPHSVEGNTKIVNRLWESNKIPLEQKNKNSRKVFLQPKTFHKGRRQTICKRPSSRHVARTF
jgi:hypothetical protein